MINFFVLYVYLNTYSTFIPDHYESQLFCKSVYGVIQVIIILSY